jgi:hypothetical protein
MYRHSQYRFWFSWRCVYPSGVCYLPHACIRPLFLLLYIYKTNYSVQIEEPVKTQKGDRACVGRARRIKKTQSESQFHPRNGTTSSSAELYPSVIVHGGTIQPARFSLAIYIYTKIRVNVSRYMLQHKVKSHNSQIKS